MKFCVRKLLVMCLVLARGICAHRKIEVKEAVTAAPGEKESVSISFFMEASTLKG